jgi:16S rRNA (cytosine967-C5)-methyltransferase
MNRPSGKPARRTGLNQQSTSRPSPRNARELAFCILDEHFQTEEFAVRLIDKFRQNISIDSREFRLAAELSYTVIRRQSTLNAIIEPHVSRPRHKVEGPLWMLLQLGTSQLVLMDQIPRHAALNETVAVAKRYGPKGWAGFLNGVLRSVEREVTDEFTTQPAMNAVPLTDGRFRLLKRNIFPDSPVEPSTHFSRAFSFPTWLAERWQKRFTPGELNDIGFWFNKPPGLTLRTNILRTSREEFLSILSAENIAAQPGKHPAAVILDQTTDVQKLPGFTEGLFTVQDESAMNTTELLNPQPGETVLDLCSAPGTKTTHLAEQMQNQGRIVATDIKDDRLNRVEQNAQRLHLEIIEPQLIRPELDNLPTDLFDAVLVDAPCSNTGVLGKRPEARWRLEEKELRELSTLQQRLLHAACDRVRPLGRVVYSTCSIERDENHDVVKAVLAERPEFSLVREINFQPGNPFDGGYQTLLQRGPSR